MRPRVTGTLISKVWALSGSGMCEHHAEAGSGNILRIYGLELMAATISGEMPTITARKIVEKGCPPLILPLSHILRQKPDSSLKTEVQPEASQLQHERAEYK